MSTARRRLPPWPIALLAIVALALLGLGQIKRAPERLVDVVELRCSVVDGNLEVALEGLQTLAYGVDRLFAAAREQDTRRARPGVEQDR